MRTCELGNCLSIGAAATGNVWIGTAARRLRLRQRLDLQRGSSKSVVDLWTVTCLYRIRWQETWGNRLSGVLDAGYVSSEVSKKIADLASKWFADGDPLVTRDRDSPSSWTISDRTTGHTVYLFVEPIGELP